MDARDMTRYLCQACDGVNVTETPGAQFFIYDPDGDLPEDRWLPFATIVTDDSYDGVGVGVGVAHLNRPDAYRLNLGLTKPTYTSMFGAAPTQRDEHGVLDSGFDYATVDQVMPHPMYGSQYWVCVVNPSTRTFEALKPMITEAYEFAVRKHTNHRRRGDEKA
jgi:hypothetical protein